TRLLRAINALDPFPDQRPLARFRPIVFAFCHGYPSGDDVRVKDIQSLGKAWGCAANSADPYAFAALMAFAASSTAGRMPAYVPQRHRLPPSPFSTCSRVGCGCLSRKALQAITNPGVQNPHCCASCSTKAAI